MLNVREASRDETGLIEPVSRLLAEAFIADPWISYLFPPDAHGREHMISRFFQSMVKAGLLYGKLLITEPVIVGAAVAMKPGHWELTDHERKITGTADLRTSIDNVSFERLQRYSGGMENIHRQDLPGRHWYLELAGVAADHRKVGIGSSLVESVLALADADTVPTYLETSEKRNLTLYGRFGFSIANHGVDPEGKFPYWTMIRPPRKNDKFSERSQA